ncbi:MAG: aminomethyl-transferring glycine dehydrogenase subunit GcvPB [Armatimonadota bacterium]
MPRTVFELSGQGKRGVRLPDSDVGDRPLRELVPEAALRKDPPALPEVTEPELARHYAGLAAKSFGVDSGTYPLGSCTMKYNPRVNERVAALPGFADLHPYQPEETVQGALRLLRKLEQMLCEIAGMDAASLQPPAGASGEFACLRIIRAYHDSRGDGARRKVLVPDSAHGTNPASVTRCGYESVTIPSNARGRVDLAALRDALDETVAAIMLTNPNTLGLFEDEVLEISAAMHTAGALLYCDGANLNAIMGKAKPGHMGFDAMHFNLHKTFSTPHGGGGPGAGPIAVSEQLAPFLPSPRIVEKAGRLHLKRRSPQSIGKVHGFYGNFLVAVRAYAYIRGLGAEGLTEVSEAAVLNANYLMAGLSAFLDVPYDGPCMHECVLSAESLREKSGVRALDIAKRLIDFRIHPPTMYFPLIVKEALMIEPTETESRLALDEFLAAMLVVLEEAEKEPEVLRGAPHTTPVGRLDEVKAAREPDVRWQG